MTAPVRNNPDEARNLDKVRAVVVGMVADEETVTIALLTVAGGAAVLVFKASLGLILCKRLESSGAEAMAAASLTLERLLVESPDEATTGKLRCSMGLGWDPAPSASRLFLGVTRLAATQQNIARDYILC